MYSWYHAAPSAGDAIDTSSAAASRRRVSVVWFTAQIHYGITICINFYLHAPSCSREIGQHIFMSERRNDGNSEVIDTIRLILAISDSESLQQSHPFHVH